LKWNDVSYYNSTVTRSISDLKEELTKVVGKKILLILSVSVPVEYKSCISGVLLGIDWHSVRLKPDQSFVDNEEKENIAVYKLSDIIGFCPVYDKPVEKQEIKEISPLEEEMQKMVGKKIKLIIPCSLPREGEDVTTGILKHVGEGIVKLILQEVKNKSSDDTDTKNEHIGIYRISGIVGFVQMPEVYEDRPIDLEKVNLNATADPELPSQEQLDSFSGMDSEVQTQKSYEIHTGKAGTLLTSQLGYINKQLINTSETGKSDTRIIISDELSQKLPISTHKNDRPVNDPNNVTIRVTVKWPEDIPFQEVDVKLIYRDTKTVSRTVNGIVIFTVCNEGSVTIKAQSVSGFITPIKEIKVTKTQENINENLYYISDHIPVTGVLLDKTEVNMFIGDTIRLTGSIIPKNAENQAIYWETSNENIVSVTNGLITAISEGEAIIAVYTAEGRKKDTARINVTSKTPMNRLY